MISAEPAGAGTDLDELLRPVRISQRSGFDRIDAACARRETLPVADIKGYRVVTTDGKRVGHVAGETERALVVECGTWPRKAWRALPRAHASVNEEERSVMMQVSKEFLVQSPSLKHGAPVDDEAVASWWALD
jgi:hypothetical protein